MHNATIDRTDRDAILRGIAVNRFSFLPRIVYADWLDEHGTDQPDDGKRAEFIRLSSELATSLAEEEHVAATWCDCDRCRTVRRVTVLKDEGMGSGAWLTVPHEFFVTNWTEWGGFPTDVSITPAKPMTFTDKRTPLLLARCFADMPLHSLAARFWEGSTRWDVSVAVRWGDEQKAYFVTVVAVPHVPDMADIESNSLVAQYQWETRHDERAPSPDKVPDTVRRLVKRTACERWEMRNAGR